MRWRRVSRVFMNTTQQLWWQRAEWCVRGDVTSRQRQGYDWLRRITHFRMPVLQIFMLALERFGGMIAEYVRCRHRGIDDVVVRVNAVRITAKECVQLRLQTLVLAGSIAVLAIHLSILLKAHTTRAAHGATCLHDVQRVGRLKHGEDRQDHFIARDLQLFNSILNGGAFPLVVEISHGYIITRSQRNTFPLVVTSHHAW